mmetsp:Transcript_16289/g.19787  ORF Transcript_16289/g.19787 Transcript_16289/m.19787 type:complete len:645 (+) Transcript_16289:227-2161(+)
MGKGPTAIDDLFSRPFQQGDIRLLSEPNLGLEEWCGRFLPSNARISVRVRIQKAKRQMTGKKAFQYLITTNDPNLALPLEAVRSEADFLSLQKQLVKRFPNSYVPPCIGPFKNSGLLELFLEAVASNPFFRNDFAFEDFVNGNVQVYKTALKRNGLSEGVTRWAQAISEEPNLKSDDQYINGIIHDFGVMLKVGKQLLQCSEMQKVALHRMEKATGKMQDVLQKCTVVNHSRIPMQILGEYDESAIQLRKHKDVLKRAYGVGAFQRNVVDFLTYDVAYIAQWEKYTKKVMLSKRAYEKANAAAEKEEGADGKKAEQYRGKANILAVAFFNLLKGVLGHNLHVYRENRPYSARRLYENFAKFQLQGSSELLKVWRNTGVEVKDIPEEEYAMNRAYGTSGDGNDTRSVGSKSSFNFPGSPSFSGPSKNSIAEARKASRNGQYKSSSSPNAIMISPKGTVGNAELPPPGMVRPPADSDEWSLDSDEVDGMVHPEVKVVKPPSAPVSPLVANPMFQRNQGHEKKAKLRKEQRNKKENASTNVKAPFAKTPAARTPAAKAPSNVVSSLADTDAANSGPSRPMMPKPNFLAEINKGAAKKLRKVSSLDKSDNIGGKKKSSSSGTPVSGNPLVAELQARMKERRRPMSLDY